MCASPFILDSFIFYTLNYTFYYFTYSEHLYSTFYLFYFFQKFGFGSTCKYTY